MAGSPSIEDIRRVILRHLGSLADGAVNDDWPLGEAGAGLDSIALVELLLDCEVSFGVPLSDSLLEAGPVTVGAIARRIEEAAGGQAT